MRLQLLLGDANNPKSQTNNVVNTMNKNLLFATVVSALGSFLFGFDTAVISGTTKFITQFFDLTDATLGLTVSIALWGTVIGSIVIGKPGDVFGRRAMLSSCGALYFISALGCALATTGTCCCSPGFWVGWLLEPLL